MLDKKEATTIVMSLIVDGKIDGIIEYGDLFIFRIFFDDPLEGQFDPYYSVNKKTKELKEFSIITDGDINEISRLFLELKERR